MLVFYLSIIENSDDEDDFIRIYLKYRVPMYNIAKSYTHDHHYAQDALQTAFIGICKNIDTVKKLDEEKLEIYVFKAAKNAAIDVLRDKNVSDNFVVSSDEQYNEIASDDDIVEKNIENELLNAIFEYIDKMPEKYRDVLSLYFLQDLNFREIADTLNLPVSTIKDRFHKGQRLVVEKFKEYRK